MSAGLQPHGPAGLNRHGASGAPSPTRVPAPHGPASVGPGFPAGIPGRRRAQGEPLVIGMQPARCGASRFPEPSKLNLPLNAAKEEMRGDKALASALPGAFSFPGKGFAASGSDGPVRGCEASPAARATRPGPFLSSPAASRAAGRAEGKDWRSVLCSGDDGPSREGGSAGPSEAGGDQQSHLNDASFCLGVSSPALPVFLWHFQLLETSLSGLRAREGTQKLRWLRVGSAPSLHTRPGFILGLSGQAVTAPAEPAPGLAQLRLTPLPDTLSAGKVASPVRSIASFSRPFFGPESAAASCPRRGVTSCSVLPLPAWGEQRQAERPWECSRLLPSPDSSPQSVPLSVTRANWC